MKYFYIYNIEQADFFIKNGLQVNSVGKGKKNDIYLKFVRDEESEKVFSLWVQSKNKI